MFDTCPSSFAPRSPQTSPGAIFHSDLLLPHNAISVSQYALVTLIIRLMPDRAKGRITATTDLSFHVTQWIGTSRNFMAPARNVRTRRELGPKAAA